MTPSNGSFALDFEKPILELQNELIRLEELSKKSLVPLDKEIDAINKKIDLTKKEIYSNLTYIQRLKISRHPQRPHSLAYINYIFTNFQEIHGDRKFGDDQALIGGIAYFGQRPVVVIGEQKGFGLNDNLKRNFGSPNPEGYRKALRLMKLAEKFSLPVITFIDTPGAYPGIGAEERHIDEAIAVNIQEMSVLKTPIIAIIIGEGGSGGALGISVADRVFILEHAYYSVISPEGCASILWKSQQKLEEALNALKLFPENLRKFGVIDYIIKEPLGGAHNDAEFSMIKIKNKLKQTIPMLLKLPVDHLLKLRYDKFRKIGVFDEK